MACYGHTPGHTAFIIDDLVIWGDLTHAMALQMPYPNVAITYDTDPQMAIKSRLKMLDYIVQNRLKAAGMHIPFPAMGSVKADEKGGYIFEPLYLK
jgi:glyoxylase-like metal-dependent hydrolase (beta-lactamase superfamily II)